MNNETKPITRMGKNELREELIKLGYTDEQLNDDQGKSLKRPDLCEKLQAHKQGSEGLDALANVELQGDDDDVGIAVVQDTKVDGDVSDLAGNYHKTEDSTSPQSEPDQKDESKPEPDVPTPNDPGWTQYVLGHFMEDEVDGKNPRVEGLRRVAGLLVGELIEEGCDLVAAPTADNGFRACVKAWAVFFMKEFGGTKRFEALADAHGDNCHEDYATYLVAMADTRAKGRVYRNALILKRIVAAEEVSKTMATAADIQAGGSIHTGQIAVIRMIADRQDFDIAQILDKIGIEYKLNDKTGDVDLSKLAYDETLMVVKFMREMIEKKREEK